MDEQDVETKISREFNCQRCNECCRQRGFVYVSADEVEIIANYLKMEIYNFTTAFCDVFDRKRLVLKKYPDEACVFLKDQGCQIHEVKPKQCIEFPFKWRTARSFEYCAGLKKVSPDKRQLKK